MYSGVDHLNNSTDNIWHKHFKGTDRTHQVVLLRPLNFTATMVVSYHRTNTAIAVFYSVLGRLSGCCFLKTAPHFSSVISSLRERTAVRSGDQSATLPAVPRTSASPLDCRDGLGTVLSETVTTVSLSAPPPSRAWSN